MLAESQPQAFSVASSTAMLSALRKTFTGMITNDRRFTISHRTAVSENSEGSLEEKSLILESNN